MSRIVYRGPANRGPSHRNSNGPGASTSKERPEPLVLRSGSVHAPTALVKTWSPVTTVTLGHLSGNDFQPSLLWGSLSATIDARRGLSIPYTMAMLQRPFRQRCRRLPEINEHGAAAVEPPILRSGHERLVCAGAGNAIFLTTPQHTIFRLLFPE